MRVPLSWLGDLVELPDADTLVERLNGAGLECHVFAVPAAPEGVLTGKILSCEKHPDADRLSVCRVDVGRGEPVDIVCGAPNAEAGRVGAVALPGTRLGDLVIEQRKLRGVASHGMLCSERELGVSEEHDGILLLPADTPVGRSIGEFLGGGDVLDTYPSSNRGDLMSIAGVAREVAALSGRAWSPSPPEVPDTHGDGGWSVAIEDPEDCPRYCGRVVEGLTAGPSPDWMADRLAAAGVRPIMNLVDVTNFVLLERGHPLHSFDREKLNGREIGVRRSRKGEALVTLDGKRRELTEGVLLITDGAGPVATGGVMGGESTMVSESTTAVFLEGASFRPERIRFGSRGMRLATDASSRFERGVDAEGVPDALDRCVELLLKLCPGASLKHVVDAYPKRAGKRTIVLRRRTLRRVLGAEPEPDDVRAILENLGLLDLTETDEGWSAVAPSFRRDLVAEEDLVEEVGRIHGYDRFPERAGVRSVVQDEPARRMDALWESRRVLLALGLTEAVTPSLIDGSREADLVACDGFFRRPVPLRNPLTSDRDSLRGSLVPSLLQVLATNRARATADVALFEVGRAFGQAEDGGVDERLRAGLLVAGRGLASGSMGSKSCDFFDMKGLVEVYVEQFWGSSPRWESAAPAPMFPGRSSSVVVEGEVVGFLGEPTAEARAAFDLPEDLPVLIAELDAESRSPREGAVTFHALPRHPGVHRDLAFVVDRDRRQEDLATVLREASGELLSEVRLFDVYEGPPLAGTEKSLAYTLLFRSPDRSLTNEEVDEVVARVVARLEERLGARIR